MLNSNKYIADGDYYQSFSYEIQSRLSMDKYADILKQLAHVVGTKMYGKVFIGSAKVKPITVHTASIEVLTNPIYARDNTLLVDRLGGALLQRGTI